MNLSATLGAGRVVVNDYVISLTRLENASRLTVSRGGEAQSVDIPDGARGSEGRGIARAVFNANDTLTLTFTDGETFTTPSLRGPAGASSWQDIGGKPAAFPPLQHSHPLSDLTGAGALIASTFDAQKTYLPGCVCLFEGALYRFTETKAPGAWDAAKAAPTSLGGELEAHTAFIKALKAGLTPVQLRFIAQSGRAREYLDIGDVIHIPWTDGAPAAPVTYQYPFTVAHIGDVTDARGELHRGAVFLQALCATPQPVAFDAAETEPAAEANAQAGRYYIAKDGSAFSLLELNEGDPIPYAAHDAVFVNTVPSAAVAQNGYNRWGLSAVRQWLNSDAPKGTSWWQSTHPGDSCPANASAVPGFLSGFTPEWRAVFAPVRVSTALNTAVDGGGLELTNDTFFLPSLEQVCGVPQAQGEGECWDWWKLKTGLAEPSNGSASDTRAARRVTSIDDPNGNAVILPLRSAFLTHPHFLWRIYREGYIGGVSYVAAYASRYLPACVVF
ncbi:MAG: DUF6273 domain-containing protein [Clostridiales bacterium]|nr:DUF6273 domain-containing protein [Clostridiales bacterium]